MNNPAGWTEIYRWDKSLGQASGVLTATAISGGVQQLPVTPNQSITLTDPATGPRLFWRLVFEKAP